MSADQAKQRLQMVLAMDRTNLRGGRKLYYRGSGQMRFDPPVTIMPNEAMMVEYEFGVDGLTRHWEMAVVNEVDK